MKQKRPLFFSTQTLRCWSQQWAMGFEPGLACSNEVRKFTIGPD